MRSSTLLSRCLSLLALPVLAGSSAPMTVASLQSGPIIRPFILDEVRELVVVESQVFVYNPALRGEIQLTRLEVRADGVLIERLDLDRRLPGDPEYGRTAAMIERLPHEVAHHHGEERYFADPRAPEFTADEVREALHEIQHSVGAMNDRYDFYAGDAPFGHVNFLLPLDQIFFPDDPAGTSAELRVTLHWVGASGQQGRSSIDQKLTWLGPFPGLPTSFSTGNSTASLHRGDMHVHTCHGEALGACSPSSNCVAETLQVSGSYTLDQLKTQYQALGMDWYTATDHSYCINSDAEYSAITAEAAAITDSSFVCVSDIELSSDEEGPQDGSDAGDAICLFTTSANHMGAHGITSRVYGGDDGLLGFCDGLFGDALNGFKQNIATIRAQGGYPVAHHPAGGTFSWESRQDALGMEANALHGVEIWNGSTQTGQGGHVKDWVDWLLGGRLLYAYSGSDTHDQAYNFGCNNVIVEGAFDSVNLQQAIRAGAVFVSNGPSLIIETDLGGATLPMGSLHTLPSPIPPATTTVRVYYDFGAGSGTVTVFRGVVGNAAESTLLVSGTLSGSGFVEVFDSLETSATSWYRAYAENTAGSQSAYTNPVFFVESSGGTFPYCTAKVSSRGCVPTISGVGTPSMSSSSPFFLNANQVHNNQFGILVYAYAPDFKPFMGGTLCLGFPLKRVTAVATGGNGTGQDCSGVLSYDFNTWIASGKDKGLASGLTLYAQWWYRDSQDGFGAGLTDGLQFTIQP